MKDNYLEILKILEKDALIPHTNIAKQLGIEADDVEKIIDELTKSKMILGYKAVLNKEKVFEDTVFAIIQVDVSPEREGGFESIAKKLYLFPEVRNLYLVSGNNDLLIFVEGKNLKSVASFVSSKLSTINRINHTSTHFILKTYKEDGIILDINNTENRLKVSP